MSIHSLNVLILELQTDSQGLPRCLKHWLSTLQLSKHTASPLTASLMQFKNCQCKTLWHVGKWQCKDCKTHAQCNTNISNQGLASSNSEQIISVSVSSFYSHPLLGGGERSHCLPPKSWKLPSDYRPSHILRRTAPGRTHQVSSIPSFLVFMTKGWELGAPGSALLGVTSGENGDGNERAWEKVGWGFLFHFSFFSLPKGRWMPLCLCQHNPSLSRAESSSSAASFVRARASESYLLLDPVRVDVTHIGQTGQSEACQLVLFPLPSLCNADVAWGPFLPGQDSAWTKQGGACVFTTGQRLEGWLAEGKGGEKKISALFISDCFAVVAVVWLLIYVCLS